MKLKKSFKLAASAIIAAFALSASAAVTSKSYIQDGLVSHWDAIENAGYGQHDNSTNYWTDLKGFADLEVVNSASTWQDDAFVPPQKSYGAAARDENSRISLYSYRTIDACMTYRPPDNDNVVSILGQNARTFSWHRNGFVSHNTTTMICPAELVTETPYSICAIYGANGSASMLTNYLDGVAAVEQVTNNHTALSVGNKFQIGRDVNEWYSSRAPVHSVRLYNRVLKPWEIQVNANVDQIRYRGTDGATLTWPDGIRFADDSVQYRVGTATVASYLPDDGSENKIMANGGGLVAEVTAWKPIEGSYTLTPVPDANHKFATWAGDVDGLDVGADGTISLDDGRFRRLICYFVPKTLPTVARTWTGAAGDGNWSTDANWSPSGAPAEYDVVTVPYGLTATLGTGEDSPNYLAIECSGTLVLSNWTTRLRAMTSVNIRNGGVLTCGAPTTNMTTMSRVWVACSNLTVETGGSIDVSRKGYYGYPGTAFHRGYGPGSSSGTAHAYSAGGFQAPSHGGYGGRRLYASDSYCFMTLLPYDDPAAPSLPGSSGSSNENGGYGGHGGGVVRIEAAGSVAVDGSVLADGRNAASYGGAGTASSWGQPGSGGSIWITCETLSGSGVIRAAGGGGDNPFLTPIPALAAGGGMVAIDYNPSLQTPASVADMTISAAAGLYKTGKFVSTCFNADTNHLDADIGTLHFTDAKIVDALLGKSLTGQIRGISNYVYDGDLVFTNGHVRFADIGVAVSVNGNLALDGDGVARLEVGGCIATNRYSYVDLYAGTTPCSLTVGGDLTLGGRSRLDIRAAATNGVDAFGAFVNVAGTMTIGSNCLVTASSDRGNLGAPKFTVGSLAVATGAVFTAESLGCRGGYGYRKADNTGTAGISNGAGPGGGTVNTGASYGGKAGGSSRNVYGNKERPLLPGSGGAAYNVSVVGGIGGGLVYVSATNGTISIDGIVNADGGTGMKKAGENRSWGYGGGGSGGAILLESRFFRLGGTGVLSACGGSSEPYTTVKSSSGGGGRIAVWCGAPWRPNLKKRMCIKSDEPLVDEDAAEYFLCEGTVRVAGGELSTKYVDQDSLRGSDGTTFFGFVRDRPLGLSLIFK